MLLITCLVAFGEDRFLSSRPHYLHPLLGRPLIGYALTVIREATGTEPYLLTDDERREALAILDLQPWPKRPPSSTEAVLFVRGEAPLLQARALRRLLETFRTHKSPLVLTAEGATAPIALITPPEVLLDTPPQSADLRRWLLKDAAHHLHIEAEAGLTVHDRLDLARALAHLQARINRHWMKSGVTLLDPQRTMIEVDVRIGRETIIHPNTYLYGRTIIGEACEIGPNSLIRDSQIGNRCRVLASVLEEAVMEDESDIGPFGHLRRGARLCRGAHMGNFGEMKNSTLGPGSKMGHFGYLGDAEVGANVNIGAGTITCNYDGHRKHRTVIEEGVFIGSDTLLVAPVHIGKGAKTGAGSVVTHDIPAEMVAYGVPARVRRPVKATSEHSASQGEKEESEP